MVATKLGPCSPYNQAVRTMWPPSGNSRVTATSPASLLRPYAFTGDGTASSGYGSAASPRNT